MNHAPIHYATVAEQAALLRSKAVSPVELTRAYLDRIDHLDSRLRAYITVLSDSALRQAEDAGREIASGRYRGPLHGIPVALKDIIHVGGVPTTAGSRVMAGFVPREDSTIVRRLRGSGAVILGKANLSEFAMGGTVDHPFGTPRNPWDPARTPGASSSGSGVAVAAGLCSAALGSDTGGSIRGPAFFCGIAGLRPTYGRVTRHGVVPLCWSMDTVGPMARSVEDCAILLSAIAGHDSADPSSVRAPVPDYTGPIEDGGRGLSIGVPREMIDFDGMDGEARDAVSVAASMLRELGASVEDASLPSASNSGGAFVAIADTEAAAFHARWLRERRDDYDSGSRTRLEAASTLPAVDYIKAQRARSVIKGDMRELLERFDALLTPASNAPAQPVESATAAPGGSYRGSADMARRRLTSPASLAGLPALSVPCGFTRSGLPVGLQLIGRPFGEATLFRIGRAYERATEWRHMHPEL